MAINTLFTDIEIKDKEALEKFANAIEGFTCKHCGAFNTEKELKVIPVPEVDILDNKEKTKPDNIHLIVSIRIKYKSNNNKNTYFDYYLNEKDFQEYLNKKDRKWVINENE